MVGVREKINWLVITCWNFWELKFRDISVRDLFGKLKNSKNVI
jgi:hypothetical protein